MAHLSAVTDVRCTVKNIKKKQKKQTSTKRQLMAMETMFVCLSLIPE